VNTTNIFYKLTMKALLYILLCVLLYTTATAQNLYLKGSSKGTIESDGDVYIGGSKKGQIESDGDIYMNGSKVGQVESDGDIYKNGSKIGECRGARKEWVGAVVFFFFIEDLAY
jgi:cytoskeletal protein CcmA (bactofilin family)